MKRVRGISLRSSKNYESTKQAFVYVGGIIGYIGAHKTSAGRPGCHKVHPASMANYKLIIVAAYTAQSL